MVEALNATSDDQLQDDLLGAVKALKTYIVNQDKLSVSMACARKTKNEMNDNKTTIDKGMELSRLSSEMLQCHLCPLGKTRHNLVFGDGNHAAQLVFVGEAPGADEDAQGLPFVGRAGQQLTKIIEAMGLSRKDVYICNILKCRPPQNRNPLPEEIAACEPFLNKQLEIMAPKVICALGTFAAQTLLKSEVPITLLRGRFHSYQGIKLMPTYHPAYLLRNPSAKKFVWEDVQIIMKELGLKPAKK
jgi:uracil-DNA glycosylase